MSTGTTRTEEKESPPAFQDADTSAGKNFTYRKSIENKLAIKQTNSPGGDESVPVAETCHGCRNHT